MTITKDKKSMSPVEVITSVSRRCRWSPKEKRAMVEEAEQPANSVSTVARKYGVQIDAYVILDSPCCCPEVTVPPSL
jgi:hypothetical protein